MALINIDKTTVKIPTLDWIRSHLTGAISLQLRIYAKRNDAAPDVVAFLEEVGIRANDVLIVSDHDYSIGINACYKAGQLTLEHANQLLSLGNHSAINEP